MDYEAKQNTIITRLIIIIVSLSMVLSLITIPTFAESGSQNNYYDMPQNDVWYYAAAKNAIDNGILKGSNGRLNLMNNITRAEFATVINNLVGASENADISKYKDVKEYKWYYSEMAKAVQMKSFVGDDSNELKPNDKITRQDAFLVLSRVMQLGDGDLQYLEKFSDYEDISSYAAGAISAMIQKGYISGNNGCIYPKDNITRAEVAQIIYNIFSEYITNSGEYSSDIQGNVIISVPSVKLTNMTINGDLIIGDGVGDGEITLDNTEVTGNVIVRGGGENSIVITNGSNIGSIVVAKTASGNLRVLCTQGARVDIVKINDGNDGIKLEGSFNSVNVSSDVQLSLTNANIAVLSIESENANVNLESGTIATVNIAESAADASFATALNTKVGTINNYGGATLETKGGVQKTNDSSSTSSNSTSYNEITPIITPIKYDITDISELRSAAVYDDTTNTLTITSGKILTLYGSFFLESNVVIEHGATVNINSSSFYLVSNSTLTNKGTLNVNASDIDCSNYINSGIIKCENDSIISIDSDGKFNNNGNVIVQDGNIRLNQGILINNNKFTIATNVKTYVTDQTEIYGIPQISVILEYDAADYYCNDSTTCFSSTRHGITCDGTVIYDEINSYNNGYAKVFGQNGVNTFKQYSDTKNYSNVFLFSEEQIAIDYHVKADYLYINANCIISESGIFTANKLTIDDGYALVNNGQINISKNLYIYGTLDGQGLFNLNSSTIYAYDGASVLAPSNINVFVRYDGADIFYNDSTIQLHNENFNITVADGINIIGKPYNDNRAIVYGQQGLESLSTYLTNNYESIDIYNYSEVGEVVIFNYNFTAKTISLYTDNDSYFTINPNVELNCNTIDLNGKLINNGEINVSGSELYPHIEVYNNSTFINNAFVSISEGDLSIDQNCVFDNVGMVTFEDSTIYNSGVIKGSGIFNLSNTKIYAYDGASVLAPSGAIVHIVSDKMDEFNSNGEYVINNRNISVTLGENISSINDIDSCQAYIYGLQGYNAFVANAKEIDYEYISINSCDETFHINAADLINVKSLHLVGNIILDVGENDILNLDSLYINQGVIVNNNGIVSLTNHLQINDGIFISVNGEIEEGKDTIFNNNGNLIVGTNKSKDSGWINITGTKARFNQLENSFCAFYGYTYLYNGATIDINTPAMTTVPSTTGFYCTNPINLENTYYHVTDSSIISTCEIDLSKIKVSKSVLKRVFNESDFFIALNDENCKSISYDGSVIITENTTINKRININELVIPAGVTLTLDNEYYYNSYVGNINVKGTLDIINCRLEVQGEIELEDIGIVIVSNGSRLQSYKYRNDGKIYNDGELAIIYNNDINSEFTGEGIVYNYGTILHSLEGEYGQISPIAIDCTVLGPGKTDSINNMTVYVGTIEKLKAALSDANDYEKIVYNGSELILTSASGIDSIDKCVYFYSDVIIDQDHTLEINSEVRFSGKLTINGNLTIKGPEDNYQYLYIYVFNDCIVNGNITVLRNATLDTRAVFDINGSFTSNINAGLYIHGNATFSSNASIQFDDVHIFVSNDGNITQLCNMTIPFGTDIQLNGYYEVNGALTNNGHINLVNDNSNPELCVMPNAELINNGTININEGTVTVQQGASYTGTGTYTLAGGEFVNNNINTNLNINAYYSQSDLILYSQQGKHYIITNAIDSQQFTDGKYYNFDACIIGNQITSISAITEYSGFEVSRDDTFTMQYGQLKNTTINGIHVSSDVTIAAIGSINENDYIENHRLTCFVDSNDEIVKIFVNNGVEYHTSRDFYYNYFGQKIYLSEEYTSYYGTVLNVTDGAITLATIDGVETIYLDTTLHTFVPGVYLQIDTDGSVYEVINRDDDNRLFYISKIIEYNDYDIKCVYLIDAEENSYYYQEELLLSINLTDAAIIQDRDKMLTQVSWMGLDRTWNNNIYGVTTMSAAEYVSATSIIYDDEVMIKKWNSTTNRYDVGSTYDLLQITAISNKNLIIYDLNENQKYDLILIY